MSLVLTSTAWNLRRREVPVDQGRVRSEGLGSGDGLVTSLHNSGQCLRCRSHVGPSRPRPSSLKDPLLGTDVTPGTPPGLSYVEAHDDVVSTEGHKDSNLSLSERVLPETQTVEDEPHSRDSVGFNYTQTRPTSKGNDTS